MEWEKFNLWINLSFVLLTLISPVIGFDRITRSNPLSGEETIISSGSSFKLGLFQPGNSSNFYIGIWYNKISEQTPVWVANRDNPISDKSKAVFKIDQGNLILTNGSISSVWSTQLTPSKPMKPLEAVLLDNGNLVVREIGSKSCSVAVSSGCLWQSFENPTHTWLPGGKIGLKKKSKTTQNLTAWKNTEDPASGLFNLELDPNGTSQYIILWDKIEQYWTSGPWDSQHKIFSLVPEMRLNYIYNFSYVDNENESYFTYTVYDSSIISRFIIDVSGQIKQLTWLNTSQQWNLFWSQPRQQCEVYAFCGAFGTCNQNTLPFCNCLRGFQPESKHDWALSDYSKGCARATPLKCNNSTSGKDKDMFFPYYNMELPQHPETVKASSAMECQSSCLNNCSCNAYAYNGQGCLIWSGILLNLKQLSAGDSHGDTLYLRLAASEFPTNSNKRLIIAVVVGSALGLSALLLIVLFICWRKKRRSAVATKTVEGSLVAFAYRDLQAATKNFSEKLGGGGFGSVFKGTLPDSSVIGVKKLDSINQGEKQFRTEVSTIGTIQHVNLVRLRGFCSDGNRKLLVYDYMPNGSLESHLFGNKNTVMEWRTRYEIALGIARGLAYLHEKCRDCIIHCDIKPENILLDADFCPKVADFGLAKLVGRDFSRVLTTMRGTRGYLAPEWISGVAVTAKADVYSYGMMILELVSGRRNTEQSEGSKIRFFPTFAANVITTEGDVLSVVDPKLEGKADAEEVTRVCKLGCWCIQDEETSRPSMGQVVQILEGVLDVNMPPIPRSLQVFSDDQQGVVFYTDSSTSQSSNVRSHDSSQSSKTQIMSSPGA